VPLSPREVYSHGHHNSVLQSHRWQTAENSAAYLLPQLEPADRLLDVGIGAGTTTGSRRLVLCHTRGYCVVVRYLGRAAHSLRFRSLAVERGLSEPAELAQLAEGWRRWAELPGAWFAVLHGEIMCRC
jgi:hypothetical protein